MSSSHSHAGQTHGKECTEAFTEGAHNIDACTVMNSGLLPVVAAFANTHSGCQVLPMSTVMCCWRSTVITPKVCSQVGLDQSWTALWVHSICWYRSATTVKPVAACEHSRGTHPSVCPTSQRSVLRCLTLVTPKRLRVAACRWPNWQTLSPHGQLTKSKAFQPPSPLPHADSATRSSFE